MRRHFSCSELVSVALGTASPKRRAEFLEHHAELCASCRDELAHLEAVSEEPEGSGDLARFGAVLSRSRLERLAKTEALADREFRSLMRLPVGARRQRIARALSRYRNPALVDLLIEESRRNFTVDPWVALSLAECAQDAAMRISHQEFGEEWAMTCLGRAHAARGNALRLIGDLRLADTALSFGWTIFSEDGNGDPMVEGEILSFYASLRTDQGRDREAESFLDRAMAVYRSLGDDRKVTKMLVQKSVVLYYALESERALETAVEALSVVSSETDVDPRLQLSAVHNYLWILQQTGRVEEAWQGFQAHASVYDQFNDSWTLLRRQWLEGTLLRDRGFRLEAERTLQSVRDGFAAEGQAFYASLVAMELAHLCLDEGRTDEVRRLADEVVPVFLAQGLKQEVSAALFLFQEAARREAATAAMVRQLIAALGQTRVRTQPA